MPTACTTAAVSSATVLPVFSLLMTVIYKSWLRYEPVAYFDPVIKQRTMWKTIVKSHKYCNEQIEHLQTAPKFVKYIILSSPPCVDKVCTERTLSFSLR